MDELEGKVGSHSKQRQGGQVQGSDFTHIMGPGRKKCAQMGGLLCCSSLALPLLTPDSEGVMAILPSAVHRATWPHLSALPCSTQSSVMSAIPLNPLCTGHRACGTLDVCMQNGSVQRLKTLGETFQKARRSSFLIKEN